ncbi:unnamed protein product, partial [Closterium sp. NIES-53]
DHFLSLEPTSLTVDLLEQHLIAVETSAVAVGAARGTPRPPFFEGSSPSPLAPSYASATAADVPVAEDVGDASASAKHRSSKGKGGRGGGGGSGGDGGGSESGGGGSSGGGGGSGGGSGSGTGGGSGGSACDGPFLHCPPVSGRFVQLTVRFSPPLLLYELGRHLATFTRRPRSSLFTLATEPPQVAASTQVSASGQVAASCSCRLLSHQTLLWHHRLGHPFLPRLHGTHSRLLVSGLPRSLHPLPPSPTPPCLPCVEGRQRADPHSSSFPPTTAPLQTLHMDVWGPARVSGQGCEHYFLLVVNNYTRYTTIFPLRSK